jgi:probable rRNA maturation factor
MTVAVEVSAADVRVPLARATVGALVRAVLRAERVGHALVSVTFVRRATIARLNRRHLGHRGPTDVLSFTFRRARPTDPVVGDIYIAPEIARAQALRLGVPVREELARLVIHGALHALGWTHPEGEGRTRAPMWRRQETLLVRTRALRARRPAA